MANGDSGTPTWYTKDEGCEFAVDEYLWLNELHPGKYICTKCM